MHHSRTGCPASSKLTLSVPARVEPPAARIARPALTARSVADGPGPPRLGDLAARLREDHPSANGLEDAHHGNGDLVADRAGTVLDDDHRPVLEVADALTRFLALLDDPHVDLLAGKHHRADRLREVILVEHGDPVQLRDAIQPVIVRDDRDVTRARERDELAVRAVARRILVVDLDVDRGFLLHLPQHLEAPAAAFAAGAVPRVREEP